MGVISHNGKVVITPNGKALIPPAGGVERVAWHQCPEAVMNFLNNVTYDTDYTYTHVTEYAPTPAVTSNTKPIGKTVDGVTYYNEVPNAETPFSSTNTAGTVKPLDRLRWINTATNNVRDIGGWACDGGTVKYGKLFRGAEVSNANDLPIFLNDMGIRAELDLQGAGGATIHVLSDVVDYCCPIKPGDDDWAFYTLENKTQMAEAIRFIFDSVKKDKPLYFHCTYGADRTGTIACIIESLLGLGASDIDKDYELTAFYQSRSRVSDLWRRLQNQINALDGNTRAEKIMHYLVPLGFTVAEINDFRTAMINGTPTALTMDVGTYTIDKTGVGEHVTFDNLSTGGTKYQPYEATITPDNGYKITDISVTMGGADVTSQFVIGEQNPFGANATAKVKIPNVTGNIIITVTAEQGGIANRIPSAINADGTPYNGGLGYSELGRRVSATDGSEKSGTSKEWCTGFIDITDATTIKFNNIVIKDEWSLSTNNTYVVFYAEDFSFISKVGGVSSSTFSPGTNGVENTLTATIPNNAKYIRFTTLIRDSFTREVAEINF